MGHMFSCARYLSIAGHTMREGKWERRPLRQGVELQGKTLGIVGFGRIGQHLGVMAKAIGMDVIAFDIFHIPGIEEQLGIPYVEMDELLAKSDFISVHAPAVDGGALIDAERIARGEGRRLHHLPRHQRRSRLLCQRPQQRQVRAAKPGRRRQAPPTPLYSTRWSPCTPHQRCRQQAHRRGDDGYYHKFQGTKFSYLAQTSKLVFRARMRYDNFEQIVKTSRLIWYHF